MFLVDSFVLYFLHLSTGFNVSYMLYAFTLVVLSKKIYRNYFSSLLTFVVRIIPDLKGNKIAEGHKASFCLEDTHCDFGVPRQWNCTSKGEQGISPNCYDVYGWSIDCQWVDMTDIRARTGEYYLRIHLNPNNKVAESDYQNNVGICRILDYGHHIHPVHCQHGKSLVILSS